MIEETATRFWPKVQKTDGCWLWMAAKNIKGYGYFRVGKRMQLAHRHVLALFGIPVPSDMCVCHHCDNPSCVNPDHLFVGDHAANSADMVKKGRALTGSSNKMAKLVESDIPKIVAMRRRGLEQKVIAKRFGVSRELISQIDTGKIWKEVSRY